MLPLRHVRYWQTASVLLLFGVLLFALMPAVWFWNDKVKLLSWFQNSDKWLHAVTFIVLALWFAGLFRTSTYWGIAAGLMLFGGFIEVCQLMLSNRTASWADIGANTVGIIIGLTVATAGLGGWSLRVEDWLLARSTGTGID